MKKVTATILAIVMLLSSVAVGALAEGATGELNIYTTVSELQYNAIVGAFQAKYPGLTINATQAGAGDCKSRIIAEAGNLPEVARFYHDEVIARARATVSATLIEAAAAGEFRPVDTDYAWRIVIAPLLFSIIWKHSFPAFDAQPFDFRRHLAAQFDLLFNGISATRKKKESP